MTIKARMKDLQVDFISLVDKGANRQRFAIFKADKAEEEGTPAAALQQAIEKACGAKPIAKAGEKPVEKGWDGIYWDEYGNSVAIGTTFNGVVQARETERAMNECRWAMDDYFYILSAVLRGAVMDPSIVDKSAAIKAACDEFKTATIRLFKGLPVEKAAELFSNKGEGMRQNQGTNLTPTAVAKAGSSGEAGVSQNPQAEAQNRTFVAQPVVGISKQEVETLTPDALKARLEEIQKAAAAQLEALTAVEKTGTDQPLQTNRDTVASNGAEGTQAPDHSASAAPAPGATGVSKAVADIVAAPAAGEGPAAAGTVNEMTGVFKSMFESFAKQMEASIDGKLTSAVALLKEDVEKTIADKVQPVAKSVQQIEKASGLSNSDIPDFDTATERNRAAVTKSEDQEWSNWSSVRKGDNRDQRRA